MRIDLEGFKLPEPSLNILRDMCPTNFYSIDVSWRNLPETLFYYIENMELDTSPDFQRGHVWTQDQKQKYVEYIMAGGPSGRDLYLNHTDWNGIRSIPGSYVLVDGKQRIDAVLSFLSDEFTAFGWTYSDYTKNGDYFPFHCGFKWNVANLKTRDEVLRWYALLNRGGVIHDEDEIQRVLSLIGTPGEPAPSQEELFMRAGSFKPALSKHISKIRGERAARQQKFEDDVIQLIRSLFHLSDKSKTVLGKIYDNSFSNYSGQNHILKDLELKGWIEITSFNGKKKVDMTNTGMAAWERITKGDFE